MTLAAAQTASGTLSSMAMGSWTQAALSCSTMEITGVVDVSAERVAMADAEISGNRRLTPAQMAHIVSEALRSRTPETFFRIVIRTLEKAGRGADALTVACMRELYRMREVEILMMLRAQWLGSR